MMQPRSLAPVTLLDLELWNAECLAALHKLELPESFKEYVEVCVITPILQNPVPDFAYDAYLPRNAETICESDRPLENIFLAPLVLSDSSYRAQYPDWDDMNRREAVYWRERTALLGHLTARLQDEWSIVDQNVFTDDNLDLYTGCWFDFAVTNALHNYPHIATNMYALLSQYNITTAHKRPCELIRSLRMAFLLEVEQRYSDPGVKRLVKMLVFRHLMTTDKRDLKGLRRIVFDAYMNHLMPEFGRTLEGEELSRYLDQFMLTILDHEFERVREHPVAADLIDNDDLVLYVWNTYVFHEMLTTDGAERVYTQLIAKIFNFTIIELEMTCGEVMYDTAMELIHHKPTAAYTFLRPYMQVARVSNLPDDFCCLDARTMFKFSLKAAEGCRAHAMFITRGPCETTWTAPLN